MIRRLAAICLFVAGSSFSFQASASDKTDTVKVLGNCESCKARIEKAAKSAGASVADWSEETLVLTVTFDEAKTNMLAIEKQIAFVGHDTRHLKASTAAYAQLHSCCQYDRTGLTGAKTCDDEKTNQE